MENQHMKERRLYPRFDVILPAEVKVGGDALEGHIFDISRGGLQLGCDRDTAVAIVPTTNQVVTPGANLQATLSFRIPGNPTKIVVEARLAVCRRVADNEYRIGMEYESFASETAQQVYQRYIEHRMTEVA